MRRSRLTGLMAIVVLAAMAACGGGGGGSSASGSSASGSSASSGPVTISFSNWQFAEPGRGDALKALVEDFNKSQKEVKVEPVTIPYPSYADTVMTQLGAGSGPDVMNMDHDVWVLAQKNHLLSDLTKAVKKPEAGFADVDSNNLVKGHRYGVGWETLTYALIINEDLLKQAGLKPPTNFQEFEAAAKAMTSGDQQFGFAFRNTMPEATGWWFDLSNWVYGHGGAWTDKNGKPTVDSRAVIDAVGKYRDFFANKYVPQGADAATYRRMFWEGHIGMMIDNMAVPSILVGKNPNLHLKVVTNPFPDPTNAMILTHLGVNAASHKQEAAAKFLNWLLEKQTQQKLIVALKGSPVGTKAEAPASVKESTPWLDAYTASSKHGKVISPTGAEDKTAKIRQAVLEEVDKVLRQSKDPAAAMKAAQAAVEDIVR